MLAVNVVDGRPNMALVGNPADVTAVSVSKVSDGSSQPLLGPDATQATGRSVLGVPHSSPRRHPWRDAARPKGQVLRGDPAGRPGHCGQLGVFLQRPNGHPLRAARRHRLPAPAGTSCASPSTVARNGSFWGWMRSTGSPSVRQECLGKGSSAINPQPKAVTLELEIQESASGAKRKWLTRRRSQCFS